MNQEPPPPPYEEKEAQGAPRVEGRTIADLMKAIEAAEWPYQKICLLKSLYTCVDMANNLTPGVQKRVLRCCGGALTSKHSITI